LQWLFSLEGLSNEHVLLLQVVAAMQCFQVLPGPAAFEEQQMAQQPTQQVQRSAALEKLLPLPSNSAQRLYAMWRVGVPLAALGSMDGLNMQVRGTAACCVVYADSAAVYSMHAMWRVRVPLAMPRRSAACMA
jgi:hypothetical protein